MKIHKVMTMSPIIIRITNQELRDWWNMKLNRRCMYSPEKLIGNTPLGAHRRRWEYRPKVRSQKIQAQRISLSVFIRVCLHLENNRNIKCMFHDIRFEAFTANKYAQILMDDQPCQSANIDTVHQPRKLEHIYVSFSPTTFLSRTSFCSY